MNRTPSKSLAVALCALTAATLGATTLTRMSDEQLTVEAAVIVQGRCTEVTGRWLDRTLVTLATIEVEDSLKGPAQDQLTVVIPGGVDVDRPVPIAVTFPGAPALFPEENVLLFLTPFAELPGSYLVVGFSQGKFTVLTDPGGNQLAASSHTSRSTVPLEQFKRRIRGFLAADPGPRVR